jgi:hypothetical protein
MRLLWQNDSMRILIEDNGMPVYEMLTPGGWEQVARFQNSWVQEAYVHAQIDEKFPRVNSQTLSSETIRRIVA